MAISSSSYTGSLRIRATRTGNMFESTISKSTVSENTISKSTVSKSTIFESTMSKGLRATRINVRGDTMNIRTIKILKRWRKHIALGLAGYGIYALIVVLVMTNLSGKRVVASSSFPHYDASAAQQISRDVVSDLLASRSTPQTALDESVLLPDLEILLPTDLHVIGSRAEGNQRLKFTTTIWNAGAGPVEVRGAENAQGDFEVFQFFHQDTTTAQELVHDLGEIHASAYQSNVQRGPHVGTFNYEHRHGHLHLSTFAHYQLWSVDENGNKVALMVENPKVGFCLMDINVVDPTRAGERVYSGCRADIQGISVGYGDEYLAQLREQDLNISSVPDGKYALVNIANPGLAIMESNYDNNAATVYLALQNGQLVPY